jgi:hypothetical protein
LSRRASSAAEGSGAGRRLGRLTEADVRARGLAGPSAWASGGVNADLRARDPAYEELRFEPVHRAAGDVRARALTRADDAWQSILLLSRAVRRLAEPDAPDDALAAGVEGPRGPVAADRVAPQVAGELAAGDEWGAALVVIASLDPSPWSPAL